MKNLRLLFLIGFFVICCPEFVICCPEFVSSTGQASQQSNVSPVERIANTALDAPPGQEYTKIKTLLRSLATSSSISDPQSQVTEQYLINQQDVNGQTPLHILLSNREKRNVGIDQVTPLLQLGADGLMAAIDRTTPLDMAAKKWGEKQADQDILRLVVKKIILDRLVHAIANNQVRPFNPTENYSDIAATSTETPTDDNLTRKLRIVFERYNITTDILQAIIDSLQVGGAQNQPTIQYHMDLLQAYMHVNNLNIDRETLGNFNLQFRALNGKNLLQLAVDRRNTRLVHCICMGTAPCIRLCNTMTKLSKRSTQGIGAYAYS